MNKGFKWAIIFIIPILVMIAAYSLDKVSEDHLRESHECIQGSPIAINDRGWVIYELICPTPTP